MRFRINYSYATNDLLFMVTLLNEKIELSSEPDLLLFRLLLTDLLTLLRLLFIKKFNFY
jgi:hypothetical protein